MFILGSPRLRVKMKGDMMFGTGLRSAEYPRGEAYEVKQGTMQLIHHLCQWERTGIRQQNHKKNE